MNAIPTRGDVIEVPWKGAHQRRVIAYTYDHPSGMIAATLPADLSVSGWLHVDIRKVRVSDDQTVDWSGEVGELRREAFDEATERAPYVPKPRTLSKHASAFEMVRFYFGDAFAADYQGLCSGRLPDWYAETTGVRP